MKTSSHFSSRSSALVLGTVLTASTLFAGFTLAQSALSIPTNLSNAVITIQKIVLSTNGTNALLSNLGSTIALDGANGNITTQPPTVGGIGGDVTIGGLLQLTKNNYKCGDISNPTAGSTECILKVDDQGLVSITDQFSGASNDDNIFKRTGSDPRNIFLATTDGSEAVAGRNPTQSYLRVGITSLTGTLPTNPDTAMVVGGNIESRGGLYIKKANTDPLANEGDNLRTVLTENFTSLQVNANEVGGINFRSSYDNGTPNQDTSFLFSADGAQTKVGINFNSASSNTIERTPAAELHVAEGGVFMVGGRPGAPSFCDTSGMCTSDVGTNTLLADTTTQKVGIGLTNAANLQKTLNVEGNAAVTDVLTVGHPTAFDPGTDKLAINGNTRANAYYYNSDRRYKSDIVALKSPLENLLKISGYHYYSKLEKKDTLGVIAQEVEAVYPELVQTDSQGYKSVQYGNLVAPIIEAIRELATKIDNLFTLYVSQQAKIDTLEARLLKLESQLK